MQSEAMQSYAKPTQTYGDIGIGTHNRHYAYRFMRYLTPWRWGRGY